VTLTFDLSTPKHITSRISQRHSLHQVRRLWDHSFLSYAADTHTHTHTHTRRHTDADERFTPATMVGVSKYVFEDVVCMRDVQVKQR